MGIALTLNDFTGFIMSKLNISPKEIVNNTFDSVNSVKSMWLRLSSNE